MKASSDKECVPSKLNEIIAQSFDLLLLSSEHFIVIPCCSVTALIKNVVDQINWTLPPLLESSNITQAGLSILAAHLTDLSSINLESLLISIIIYEREARNINGARESAIVISLVRAFISTQLTLEA